MECSNPACKNEKFKVTVEHKSIDSDHPDRLPVKLVCAKCRKPVKVWITNTQMKQMVKLFGIQSDAYIVLSENFIRLIDVLNKPWWKFW